MTRILVAAVVALALALGWSLWRGQVHKRDAETNAETAERVVQSLGRANDIIDIERDMARRMAGVAADYEQERRDVQDRADRVVADLNAGNVSLHRRWQACAATADLSAAATATGELDAGAADRAESAGRAIAAAAACDAQVRGLQAVIRADREGMSLE